LCNLALVRKRYFSVKKPMSAKKSITVQLASSGETEEAGLGTA
jgi:hypothetical protein